MSEAPCVCRRLVDLFAQPERKREGSEEETGEPLVIFLDEFRIRVISNMGITCPLHRRNHANPRRRVTSCRHQASNT